MITYLITLSLEKEIIVLEPKICTVISQKFLTLRASTFISMCLFTVVKCENIYQIHYKSKSSFFLLFHKRETCLLIDSKNSSSAARQRVAIVVGE